MVGELRLEFLFVLTILTIGTGFFQGLSDRHDPDLLSGRIDDSNIGRCNLVIASYTLSVGDTRLLPTSDS